MWAYCVRKVCHWKLENVVEDGAGVCTMLQVGLRAAGLKRKRCPGAEYFAEKCYERWASAVNFSRQFWEVANRVS